MTHIRPSSVSRSSNFFEDLPHSPLLWAKWGLEVSTKSSSCWTLLFLQPQDGPKDEHLTQADQWGPSPELPLGL